MKSQMINLIKIAVGSIYWIGAMMSLTLIIFIPETQYEETKVSLGAMGIMIAAIMSFIISELLTFIVND
jgi:branched-subunit amino acid ABC-type transport system permease component